MKYNFFKKKNYINFTLISIIIFGIYLSLVGGYGSDEDTLALIGAFESMMSGERVMASRFTPYPVAEIGIGFLSYQFGSAVANLVTFSFIILSCLFFFLSLSKKNNLNEIALFLILCLSNPVLFFDNIEPIDYSWAFVFLTLGLFSLKKNYYELAILFFGISIGTRINFILFVFVIIFFFDHIRSLNLIRRVTIFISSFFIGGLFYLTIWFQHGFGLDWLTAVTPNNQGVFGLAARFTYKTIISITILSFIFILINYFFFLKKKKNNKYEIFNLKLILVIILSNLILFFFIPAELSYLQPFLVALYFMIFQTFSKRLIIILIIVNLSSWFIDINFLKIKYKSNDICNNVEAISAKLDIKIEKGRLFKYFDSRDKIKCWIKDSSRGEKILQGKPLK